MIFEPADKIWGWFEFLYVVSRSQLITKGEEEKLLWLSYDVNITKFINPMLVSDLL